MQKIKSVGIMVLLLIFTASLAMQLPATHAQAPSQKTYAFIDAVPNPVGVNEDVLIRFGILQALGTPDLGWKGLTVTATKPDGTTQSLGEFTRDSTGGTTTIFVPEQAGTYKLTMNFPEQAAPATYFDLERGSMIFEG